VKLDLEAGGVVRTVHVTPGDRHLSVLLDGQEHIVDAVEIEPGRWSLLIEPGRRSVEARVRPGRPGAWTVHLNGTSVDVTRPDASRGRDRAAAAATTGGATGAASAAPARLTAPMPGKVVRVLAAVGDRVEARQAVVVIEAMKMENELRAPREGAVLEVFAKEGSSVDAGAPLLTIG
jgi:biotin carboxyl carrier protein